MHKHTIKIISHKVSVLLETKNNTVFVLLNVNLKQHKDKFVGVLANLAQYILHQTPVRISVNTQSCQNGNVVK